VGGERSTSLSPRRVTDEVVNSSELKMLGGVGFVSMKDVSAPVRRGRIRGVYR